MHTISEQPTNHPRHHSDTDMQAGRQPSPLSSTSSLPLSEDRRPGPTALHRASMQVQASDSPRRTIDFTDENDFPSVATPPGRPPQASRSTLPSSLARIDDRDDEDEADADGYATLEDDRDRPATPVQSTTQSIEDATAALGLRESDSSDEDPLTQFDRSTSLINPPYSARAVMDAIATPAESRRADPKLSAVTAIVGAGASGVSVGVGASGASVADSTPMSPRKALEQSWVELVDSATQHRYFANIATRETSWSDPRDKV